MFAAPWEHVIEDQVDMLQIDFKKPQMVLGFNINAPYITNDHIPTCVAMFSDNKKDWIPVLIDLNDLYSAPQVS